VIRILLIDDHVLFREALARLLRGDAAVAFEHGGRLVLEARSYQPLSAAPLQAPHAGAGPV